MEGMTNLRRMAVLIPEELLPFDGSAILCRDFLSTDAATALFAQLLAATTWEHRHIIMFGKQVAEPRLSSWHSVDARPYTYSGLTREAQAWTPTLQSLSDECERFAGSRFNSVLVNLYRDGRDAMGWHADNERENGRNPVIASVSLGAERRFDLRHRETKTTIRTALPHGSLLVMSGVTQHKWVHQVPRTTRVNEPRINLTFRWVHDAA